MLLKTFVQRYDISREVFDAAIKKQVAFWIEMGWDMTVEEYEVPNGDIIYTFDDEIINEYYRYE